MNWYRDDPYEEFMRRRYSQRPDYVPVPPGVDALEIMKFMDRVQRRNEYKSSKDKKKEEEKAPKCPECEKAKKSREQIVRFFQWAVILYVTAPLAIVVNHFITNLIEQAVK